MKKCFVFSLFIIGTLAFSKSGNDQVTIYNDNFSLIRTKLEMKLNKGVQDYYFEDIPSTIDSRSVILTNSDLQIIAQNYEFDMANSTSIMQKYIGKEIELETENDYKFLGILQFSQEDTIGLLENVTNKLILVNRSEIRNITLAKLPDNFYLKPTLHWRLAAPKKGTFPTDISYLCNGLSWDVNYNCVWNPNDKMLLINSWVTIKNYSGKAYDNIKLKLIAGDVQKIRQQFGRSKQMALAATDSFSAPEFSEKAFHDFHLYTLDQNVSIANKQIKQLQLFPAKNVSAKQNYAYQTFTDKVKSKINFTNNKSSGLNIPLPKGTIKIYQKDMADGNMEFIGEDQIDHTSLDQEVSVTTGNAFDLIAETITSNTIKISRNVHQKEIKVLLKNRSKQTKTIEIDHYIYGDWEIIEKSNDYKKVGANKIRFEITVASGKDVELSWTEKTRS